MRVLFKILKIMSYCSGGDHIHIIHLVYRGSIILLHFVFSSNSDYNTLAVQLTALNYFAPSKLLS